MPLLTATFPPLIEFDAAKISQISEFHKKIKPKMKYFPCF